MENKRKVAIEIPFVVLFIVLFSCFMFFNFYKIKSSIRNNIRKGNVADIQKALLSYHNQTNNYPISIGECIDENSSVSQRLESIEIINQISYDPIYPSDKPVVMNNQNIPESIADSFCFWYISDGDTYNIYYYLEPSSVNEQGGVAKNSENSIRK